MNRDVAKKTLIFRLSSFGDVILASAALEEVRRVSGGTGAPAPSIDWVVARGFESLLQGHPQIDQLWVFDRRAGLAGWLKLCESLWKEGYDEILDLHSNLRTTLARLYFWIRGMGWKGPRWRVLRKPRFRTWGYLILKDRWPQAWRPPLRLESLGKFFKSPSLPRPELRHLIQSSVVKVSEPYFCVMPSSRWHSKQWPVQKYLDLHQKVGGQWVILGLPGDEASRELIQRLPQAIPALGIPLGEVADLLARAKAYIGVDTGLAHLAEAVGTPALVAFGPTTEQMGFGPWKEHSLALGIRLGCRPCGKDGRYCYRFTRRYACLRDLGTEHFERAIRSLQ